MKKDKIKELIGMLKWTNKNIGFIERNEIIYKGIKKHIKTVMS